MERVMQVGHRMRRTAANCARVAGTACREAKHKASAFFGRFMRQQHMVAVTNPVGEKSGSGSEDGIGYFETNDTESSRSSSGIGALVKVNFAYVGKTGHEKRFLAFAQINYKCPGLNSGDGLDEPQKADLKALAYAHREDFYDVGWSPAEIEVWKELEDSLEVVPMGSATDAAIRRSINAAWKAVLALKPVDE